MSHIRNLRFTDAVKDVIGNEPVLDQFDTFYAASFYGTMSDDYVTGAMLNEARGRAFSRLYSRSEAIPAPSVGMPDPNWGSNLSSYLQPLFEKTGNSYRNTSFYDETERIYDSCLINLNTAFVSNGVSVKYISNNILSDKNSDSIFKNLSVDQYYTGSTFNPLGNVEIENTGFVTFNMPKFSGDSRLGDPSIDNTWTWSFPYENRYDPKTRELSSINFGAKIAPTKFIPSMQYDANVIDFPLLKGPVYSMPTFTPMSTYANSSYETTKVIEKLFVSLPGNLSSEHLPPGARNGNRVIYPYESAPYLYPIREEDDSIFGFSYLIPSDKNLGKYEVNNSINYSFGTPPNKDNMTKILFGFGSVNNMTYAAHEFIQIPSASYHTDFWFGASSPVNIHSHNMSLPGSGNGIILDWSGRKPYNSVVTGSDGQPSTHAADSTNFNLAGSRYWRLVSASYSPSPNYWVPFQQYSEFELSASAYSIKWPYKHTSGVGGYDRLLITDQSLNKAYGKHALFILNVTSSYSWNYEYVRGVFSEDNTNTLSSWVLRGDDTINAYSDEGPLFSSLFSINQTVPDYNDNIYFVNGMNMGLDAAAGDSTRIVSNKFTIDPEQDTYKSMIFGPGTYSVAFIFQKNADDLNFKSMAFMTDLKINTYPSSSFFPQTGSFVGGNNYPEFRELSYDPGTSYNYQQSGNKRIERHYRSTITGISPIIRGWKYGLYSGFPSHTRSVFRRDRFGQFRDMLEQRIYTKFINDTFTPFGNIATPGDKITKDPTGTAQVSTTAPKDAAVEVKFVKQTYARNERGIGKIYLNPADPAATNSQNLSTEVTSSLPYFDGVARNV